MNDEERLRLLYDNPHDGVLVVHHVGVMLGEGSVYEEQGEHLMREFQGSSLPHRCARHGCDLWLAEDDDVGAIAESTPCPAKTEMFDHKAGDDGW